jgi:hypothetical protein
MTSLNDHEFRIHILVSRVIFRTQWEDDRLSSDGRRTEYLIRGIWFGMNRDGIWSACGGDHEDQQHNWLEEGF